MNDRKLIVTIHRNGTVTTRVEGVCGTGCDAFAAVIENALGTKQSDVKTEDYYAAPETVTEKQEG